MCVVFASVRLTAFQNRSMMTLQCKDVDIIRIKLNGSAEDDLVFINFQSISNYLKQARVQSGEERARGED